MGTEDEGSREEENNDVDALTAERDHSLSPPGFGSQCRRQEGLGISSGSRLSCYDSPTVLGDLPLQGRSDGDDEFLNSEEGVHEGTKTQLQLSETRDHSLAPLPVSYTAVKGVLDKSLRSSVEKHNELPDDDDQHDVDLPSSSWLIKDAVAERVLTPIEMDSTRDGQDVSGDEDDDDGPPPGWQSLTPSLPPSTSLPRSAPLFSSDPPLKQPSDLPPQPPPEMAQMVCGSCRGLLSYPKGYRHVQCASCKVTNYVLEAHELGIVKCDYCATLLMYPYSASSIRCASCRSVTEIGEHNKRPPWSVQQGNPPQFSNHAR